MEQVSLSDIFKECHSMVSPLTEQNNLSLDFTTATNSYVIADYTRLKQVMLNLLSNAIKYNVTNGSVSLKIKQKDNGIVRICIIDTGKGISEQLLPDVFQAFNRLNAASSIEGTGIGLSISKQLVEMMNGTIGVTSKINQGSEFWIELSGGLKTTTAIKHDSAHDNKPDTSNPPIITGEVSSHNILVAEDNPTNQTLILNQLSTLGYEADLVKNGQEALNKLVNNSYQLLLTDCNMPLVDGYKLTKTIREKGNDKLSIIALTADAFPETKAQCLKAGMNDQITKPVDLNTLKLTLEKYLN